MNEELTLVLDVLHDMYYELYCDVRRALYSAIEEDESILNDDEKATIDYILDEYTHSSRNHRKYE